MLKRKRRQGRRRRRRPPRTSALWSIFLILFLPAVQRSHGVTTFEIISSRPNDSINASGVPSTSLISRSDTPTFVPTLGTALPSPTPNDDSNSGLAHLSLAEQKAVYLVGVASAILSILGSSAICYMILSDWHTKRKSAKYRILLCLSLTDLLVSFLFCFWAPMMPRGTPGVWPALGNYATCQLNGFINQMNSAGAFYSMALSHYFLLTLRYNLKEKDIATRHEPIIHIVAIGFPILTSIAALFQGLYNPSALGCWISAEPRQCYLSDTTQPCNRGEHAVLFAWLYQGIPISVGLVYIAIAMGLIYQKVQEVSQRAQQWEIALKLKKEQQQQQQIQKSNNNNADNGSDSDESSSEESHTRLSMSQVATNLQNQVSSAMSSALDNLPRPSLSAQNNVSKHAKRTQEAAYQSLLYVLAFGLTRMWCFLVFHIDMFLPTVPVWLLIVNYFFFPLQGILNVFVFIRPRIRTLRKLVDMDNSNNNLNGNSSSSIKLPYWRAAYWAIFNYDEQNPSNTTSVLRSSYHSHVPN